MAPLSDYWLPVVDGELLLAAAATTGPWLFQGGLIAVLFADLRVCGWPVEPLLFCINRPYSAAVSPVVALCGGTVGHCPQGMFHGAANANFRVRAPLPSS